MRLYLIIYIAIKQAELYSLTKEQAEKEKLLNNQLNAILDNMPFMAWLKDKEGSLMAVNEQFARMCNTTVEDILGKTDLDFFPRKYAEEYREEDLEVMRRKQTRSREEPIIGPDGVKWYETFKSPVFDKELKLPIAKDPKKVEQMKDEFVSTVSHELRTPLTSIKGALGLLLSGVMGELPDEMREMVNISYESSDCLIRLVNDILDMRKIEDGKMVFNIEYWEIMPIVYQAMEQNKFYAQEYNVKFEISNTLPETKVKVDKERLLQVITNLLSNAAKFSPENGFISVSVVKLNDMVRVSVNDQGKGVPEEFRDRIFQRFSQADSSDSRQKGGTGLGLNISKLLIEKMDGNIGFELKINEGTTFYFDLPQIHD